MRHLKIQTLPSSKHWVDSDIVMLHACFQLLKNVVEKEKILEVTNKEYKKYYDEILFLYEWWEKKVESDYEDDEEADEMLLRLIKIRNFLWT